MCFEFQQTPPRHGILYDSSASQTCESTGFRKIPVIFTLLRMIFQVMNALNYVEKTKYCPLKRSYVEILQEMAFHN